MHPRGRPIAQIGDDERDLLAVQKTLQGDSEAFSEIVDRYTKVLYTLAFRLLGGGEEAEDAVQEIFMITFRSLKSFRIGARFYSWLYTIAVNSIRSTTRKERRRQSHRRLSLDADNQPRVADSRENVELRVISESEETRAEKAVRALKPIYRIVFVLRFVEDMSLKEISDVLHMPVGTVKARIHRARKQLIDVLTANV